MKKTDPKWPRAKPGQPLPPPPKRKFLTVLPDWSIRINAEWLKRCGLIWGARSGLVTLEGTETTIVAAVAGMQSGRISWMVMNTTVDSPITYREGTITGTSFSDSGRSMLEAELNDAFAILLRHWKDEFLPPYEVEQ